MKLLKKDFYQMVIEEAQHLREHATDEEKSKLDFDKLRVSSVVLCIYGQMTGVCNSPRAKELFSKTFEDIGMSCDEDVRKGCTTFRELTNMMDVEAVDDEYAAWSPIEVYITLKGSKNENLIQYIKGETNVFKP